MQSIRKIVCKPRVDDWSPLAKFYYADESLNTVAAELDSFDGRRDPDRCNQLVNKLRQCQDRVLQIIEELQCAICPSESVRAPRDFRVKFPDDILHDNLPGQLWFGAECLAAGSNIIDHEFESDAIRPLAKALTRHLDKLRDILKDQSLRNPSVYPEKLKQSLKRFDYLFAEFELNYVSAMVPVKSVREYDAQLDVAVLFCETLMRSMICGYVSQDQIDDCDPSVMITLPRLAIIAGLLIYPNGPLDMDRKMDTMSEMFRPFQNLLRKIRELLRILDSTELAMLERALCSQEEPQLGSSVTLIAEYRNQSKPAKGSDAVDDELNPNIPVTVGSPSSVDEMIEDRKLPESSGLQQADSLSSDSSQNSAMETIEAKPEEVSGCAPQRVRRRSGSSECSGSTGSSCSEEESADALTTVRIGMEAIDGTGEPDVEITSWKLNKFCQTSSKDPSVAPVNESERLQQEKRQELRSRFKSSDDLIHRLFVCIAGVADQLQTNYPADLRSVLKMVLQPNEAIDVFEVNARPARGTGREEEVGVEVHESLPNPAFHGVRWVPDSECVSCTRCEGMFTLVRRRHHCRNCGQIFCGKCSVNSLPLPELGYNKAVRVCNTCFFYKLNPFISGNSAADSSGEHSSRLTFSHPGTPAQSVVTETLSH